jgi:alpha-beta hydrolase superfamily lysophospholipase
MVNVNGANIVTPVAPAPESFTVATADGITLFVAKWARNSDTGSSSPKSKKKLAPELLPALLIVHGLGEHGGRYGQTATDLLDTFSEVYAVDLRGHGRSAGTRGYVPHFTTYHEDLDRVVEAIATKIKGPSKDPTKDPTKDKSSGELYILGHSMGGLVVLSYLQNRPQVPFSGAMISAPLLDVAMAVPKWKERMGKLLSMTLSKIQLHNEINPSHLSHDAAVVEAYVNDRLVHQKITPALYFSMRDVMAATAANHSELPCRALFMLPMDDHIVSTPATQKFYAALKDRKKALREYEGFYHEILNEVDRSRVLDDIRGWVKNAVKNA